MLTIRQNETCKTTRDWRELGAMRTRSKQRNLKKLKKYLAAGCPNTIGQAVAGQDFQEVPMKNECAVAAGIRDL